MLYTNWIEFILLVSLLVVLAPLLGQYIANVFQGQSTALHPILSALEERTYRIGGMNSKQEMTWKRYLGMLLLFNFFGLVTLILLQRLQGYLPYNPQGFGAVPWSLAFNTAVSFVTNTNWQAYAGETTLSYGTQMFGLTVQNFLSAATGGAVLMALIRGIARREVDTIGNFWQDLVRMVVYVLLPLSILLAIVLMSQGVIQTVVPYQEVTTLEGSTQTVALGPVASQVAIKQIGTNGGGFFNANGAHPFENPTGLTNFLETLAILLVPAALPFTFGKMANANRHGWLLFLTMLILWLVGLAVALYAERLPNPLWDIAPLMEGKETRFGVSGSVLWSVSTTATSNGSVNAMISSMTPLAGAVALFNMILGEIVFGGVGVGLCGMIIFTILTVFLSGLMVGRTPEYLGKKIEKREIQWVMAGIMVPSAVLLVGAGISVVLPDAVSSIANQGPHGLSEIFYAFASASFNNGSAFAGLNANTPYFNIVLGIVMLIGRLAILVPSVAIAGLLARKKILPPSKGTFSTSSALFMTLLVGVILIVGALTFFSVMALGPIAEHYLMLKGRVF